MSVSAKQMRVATILMLCGVLSLFLAVSRTTFAQVTGATVSGVVHDTTGAIIPSATIVITDTATGVSRTVSSNGSGYYTAPDLQPGPYEIDCSAKGFAKWVRTGVTLAVGAQDVLNVTLKVGQVTQTVRINAQAPAVNLTSSTLSNQVLGPQIRQLPLNGRDWTSLATLQPGVISLASAQYGYTQNGQNRTARGYGSQLTVAGSPPFGNVYRVDGIVINDYANGVPGDALGVSLGVDAIQEFNVLSRNYSASYGRTAGGVITAATRAGTNSLHGTAYEFLRNSALDSRNYFDPPSIPPLRRNQFGVSAGGPVRKNKTFVFGDYEGLRQSLSSGVVSIVPSEAARGGNLCSIPTGVTPNCTPTTVAVDSAVQPYLALWNPVNGGLIGNGDTGFYNFVSKQVISGNYGFIRFDQHFSQEDTFFASYTTDQSHFTQPDNLNAVQVLQETSNKRIVLAETHIFGSGLVNSFRFGFNRVNAFGGGGTVAINPAAGDPSLGIVGIPPVAAQPLSARPLTAPGISVSGITTFHGGLVHQSYNTFVWNSFQAYDDLALTLGKHALEFGAAFEHDTDAKVTYVGGAGSFSYNSLEAFLTNGKPTSFSATIVPPTPLRHYGITIPAAYIADQFHAMRNLTLDLGLRYEMMTVPNEKDGLIAELPSIYSADPILGNPMFVNPTLRNFEPRIGFAWDPFGNGKTSIRSGFGIYDVEILPYQFHALLAQAYPLYQRLADSDITSTPTNPAFPNGALAQTLAAGSYVTYVMQRHPKRSYVMQWNLSVERSLTPNLSLMAAYVGSRGLHLEDFYYNANIVSPTLTSAGYLWPTPIGSGVKPNPNPNFSQIFYMDWNNESTYNGLVAQVQRRFSHGFQIQASYTWSKSFDNCTCGVTTSSMLNSLQNQFYFAHARALSDYQIKNNLVINSMWNLPIAHVGGEAGKLALEGWQLGGIFTIRNGLPFSLGISGDPLGTRASGAIPTDFVSYLRGTPGCGTPVNQGNVKNYIRLSCFSLPMATSAIASQCVPFASASTSGTCQNLLGNFGRNSIFGPGLVNLDFSIFKNTPITERLNSQFRFEFFNVFNHPNFDSPGLAHGSADSLYNAKGVPISSAPIITSTSNFSRQIQVALKFIW